MMYIHGRCLLKLRLRQHGLKQADIVNRTQYTRSQISDYANDRVTMSIDALRTISEVIGCDMKELYEWVDFGPSKRKSRS